MSLIQDTFNHGSGFFETICEAGFSSYLRSSSALLDVGTDALMNSTGVPRQVVHHPEVLALQTFNSLTLDVSEYELLQEIRRKKTTENKLSILDLR